MDILSPHSVGHAISHCQSLLNLHPKIIVQSNWCHLVPPCLKKAIMVVTLAMMITKSALVEDIMCQCAGWKINTKLHHPICHWYVGSIRKNCLTLGLKTYFPSLHFFNCTLCSLQPKEFKKALKSKNILIFGWDFCLHTQQAMQLNPVPAKTVTHFGVAAEIYYHLQANSTWKSKWWSFPRSAS